MKTIKVNNFEIELGDRGIVTLKQGKNEIFLGNYQGNRFNTLLQALKTAKELGYLSELEEEPNKDNSPQDAVPTLKDDVHLKSEHNRLEGDIQSKDVTCKRCGGTGSIAPRPMLAGYEGYISCPECQEEIKGEPDIEYAKWLNKRYNLGK